MTGDRTTTDSAVGMERAEGARNALKTPPHEAAERLEADAEVLADELNDLAIRVIEDPDGDRARYTGDIGRDLRTVLSHLRQVEADRDALCDAVKAFLAYDGHNDGDGVGMMLAYDTALTKAKAALTHSPDGEG